MGRHRLKTSSASAALLVAFATGCGENYGSSYGDDDYSPTASYEGDSSYGDSAEPLSLPRKPMPQHGRVIWLTSESNKRILKSNIANGAAGRLTISVPSGDKTYYVKLKEVSPGSGEVMGAFVRAGRTLTVDVPLNGDATTTYALHYAAGTSWYGREDAFGPEGLYAKADETFSFDHGTGWQVELILQPGGNLGTSGLDYSEF